MREYVITDFVYSGTPVRAAALFEDGRMEELRAERRDETSLVGRVYRGVVDSVNRNIGGAFVDIGSGGRGAGESEQHRDGLVYMPVPRAIKRPEGSRETKDRPHDMAGIRATLPVLVQITKDAVGPKQPVATENITLAGRYLVLSRFGGREIGAAGLPRPRPHKCRPRGQGSRSRRAFAPSGADAPHPCGRRGRKDRDLSL